MTAQTYEAWRISYQSSEQAARAAFARVVELDAEIEQSKASSHQYFLERNNASEAVKRYQRELEAIGAGGVSVPAREHDLQDVRCECCGYMTYHREHMGCIHAARAPAEQQAAPKAAPTRTALPEGWTDCTIEFGNDGPEVVAYGPKRMR